MRGVLGDAVVAAVKRKLPKAADWWRGSTARKEEVVAFAVAVQDLCAVVDSKMATTARERRIDAAVRAAYAAMHPDGDGRQAMHVALYTGLLPVMEFHNVREAWREQEKGG